MEKEQPNHLIQEVAGNSYVMQVDQQIRLAYWDAFIDGIKTDTPRNWHDRWEEMSRQEVENRNREIGWSR